jgi:hypothetical protein
MGIRSHDALFPDPVWGSKIPMMLSYQALFGNQDSIGKDPDSMDAESGNQDPLLGNPTFYETK